MLANPPREYGGGGLQRGAGQPFGRRCHPGTAAYALGAPPGHGSIAVDDIQEAWS